MLISSSVVCPPFLVRYSSNSPVMRKLKGPTTRDKGQIPDARTARKPLLRERFQLLADCPDEAAQRKLYERLAAEGWRLRVLTI